MFYIMCLFVLIIFSFNSYQLACRKFLSQFYRWRNMGPKWLNIFWRNTQAPSGEARFWVQVCWLWPTHILCWTNNFLQLDLLSSVRFCLRNSYGPRFTRKRKWSKTEQNKNIHKMKDSCAHLLGIWGYSIYKIMRFLNVC